MNDCSWYRQCDVASLGRKSSHMHRTYTVRRSDGSLAVGVADWLTQFRRRAKGPVAFERPKHLFFHELTMEHVLLHSRRPVFTSPNELHEWAAAIRHGQWGKPPRWRSCAVVGSSAALLQSEHGQRIDAHEAVIRVNVAKTVGYERHVGTRTSARVWGYQLSADNDIKWTEARENIIYYCGPNLWPSWCWKWIPTSPRLRLSPFAWEEAALSIASARAPKAGARFARELGRLLASGDKIPNIPTSGAMAVWTALGLCDNVTIFGFGWCGKGAASGGPSDGLRHSAVYYDPFDGRAKVNFTQFHDYAGEWHWLAMLARRQAIVRVC